MLATSDVRLASVSVADRAHIAGPILGVAVEIDRGLVDRLVSSGFVAALAMSRFVISARGACAIASLRKTMPVGDARRVSEVLVPGTLRSGVERRSVSPPHYPIRSATGTRVDSALADALDRTDVDSSRILSAVKASGRPYSRFIVAFGARQGWKPNGVTAGRAHRCCAKRAMCSQRHVRDRRNGHSPPAVVYLNATPVISSILLTDSQQRPVLKRFRGLSYRLPWILRFPTRDRMFVVTGVFLIDGRKLGLIVLVAGSFVAMVLQVGLRVPPTGRFAKESLAPEERAIALTDFGLTDRCRVLRNLWITSFRPIIANGLEL